jgi:hypothetical protein
MCKLAGVHVTVLYDPKGRHTFLALPLRFDKQVFECEPVFSCTFNHSHRCLVIDDLLAMRRAPLVQEPLDRRALAVHDMIHNLYRPDTFLLPVRVEVRKYFGYSQLVEVMDLARGLPYPSHAISVKPMPLHGRDLHALLRTRTARAPIASSQHIEDFLVTKGEGPDMYYVSVPHASPQLLSVKTMQQSLMLAQKFDGVGSRLKMALRWEDGRLTIRDQC